MKQDVSLFIDFDSTFIKVESLDILGEISLLNHPHKKERLEKISEITNLAMSGKIPFSTALADRIKTLDAYISQIDLLVEKLNSLVSDSILKNKSFFQTYHKQIYILSGGFIEFIEPVVSNFGILEENIFANEFLLDTHGKIIGCDTSNVLSQDGGKVTLLRKLDLKNKVYMIGDGYSDYEVYKEGVADLFFAFTENITRKSVISNSQNVIQTFDEFLKYIKKDF